MNKAADALSRMNPTVELNTLISRRLLDVEMVMEEVKRDEELQGIIEVLKENPGGKAN